MNSLYITKIVQLFKGFLFLMKNLYIYIIENEYIHRSFLKTSAKIQLFELQNNIWC